MGRVRLSAPECAAHVIGNAIMVARGASAHLLQAR